MKKLTAVKQYLSLTTAVRSISNDCQTDEDAAVLIAEGLVKVNGKVIKDSYYALSPGEFTLQVGNAKAVECNNSCISEKFCPQLLKFANEKANITKLRNGEGLAKKFEDDDGDIFAYRLALAPPDFNGNALIACYHGFVNAKSGIGSILRGGPRATGTASGITECGAKV